MKIIETEKRLKFASRYLSPCYQFYGYKHKLKSSHPFKFVNNRKMILIFNDYELKNTQNLALHSCGGFCYCWFAFTVSLDF